MMIHIGLQAMSITLIYYLRYIRAMCMMTCVCVVFSCLQLIFCIHRIVDHT